MAKKIVVDNRPSKVFRGLTSVWSLAAALFLLSAALEAQNATQIENAKPGSSDWQLTNPATNHEIEGYASLASVNRGGQINFFVSTADSAFTLEVFRMGWYGGAGARRMMAPVQLAGTRQSTPPPDPTTGMVECQWTNPYTLSIPYSASDPTNWASGVYLVRLTAGTSSKQSFIIFAVRDDSRPSSDYVFQLSMNTMEAYNNWGGKSLYTWNSTGTVAATQVSFNRPFAFGNQLASASGVGAGEFLTTLQNTSEGLPAGWSYNTLRFLEREGYDVTYICDVDAHENANQLLSHKAILIVAHSEYWSWQMRMNVQAARDAGVSIGVFSANTCYWQVRFASSSATGASDRTLICYKTTADPYASNPGTANMTTVMWRQSPVNLPEETLFGVMYNTDQQNGDLIVATASNWVYTYTGLQNGSHLPGLWGYEIDGTHGFSPNGWVDLAHEATASGFGGDSVVYTANSGATVFDTGSFQWNWGLDDYNVPNIRPSVINASAQQIMRNLLGRFAGQALAPSFSIIPSPRIQTVNPVTGGNVNYTISITSMGYSPTVSFSVSGLPSNTSASLSSTSVSGSGSSTLTVSVGSGAPLGIYPLAITASDGAATRIEAVTLKLTNALPKNNWKLVFADSQETQCWNGTAVNGFDGNPATMWHTQFCPTIAPLPHEMQIDLGAAYNIAGFGYLPRQDVGINGRIGQYEFYASNNPSNWGSPVATGTFANDPIEKQVSFTPNTYRYVRLRALTEANGAQFTSMAELDVFTSTTAISDFSISASPGSQTVVAGGSTSYLVNIGGLSGFSGTVNLSASGLPSGAAASFNPGSVTGSGSSTLTVTTSGSTPSGSSALTITGTSGSLVHSATATLAVGSKPQTITFGTLSNVSFGAAPFTVSATASSGLPVSFASTTAPVCTLSGVTVTLVAAGTCSVTASQAGNSNYLAATPVIQSFTINKQSQSITFAAPHAVTLPASPFALTATASSGLPVSFVSTTTNLCTVSGSTLTPVAAGTCSIAANQAGNANYAAAASVTQSFTISGSAGGGGGGSGGSGGGGGGGGTGGGGGSFGGGDSPFNVSPTSLTFNVPVNSAAATQKLTLAYPTVITGTYTFATTVTTNQGVGWLSVSPVSGNMPQVSLVGLEYTYGTTVTVGVDPTGIPAGSSYTGTVNVSGADGLAAISVVINVLSEPTAQPTGVANAASAGQAMAQVVAPGSYVAIYGTGLAADGSPSAISLPLPTTLNGTQLLLCGKPMPLLYASARQVNAIVPQGLAPNTSCPLVVVQGTAQSAPVPLTVTQLQPGIYTVDTSGSGPGIVTNSITGLLINASNPAHASDYLTIYCTGLGALQGPNGENEPGDGVAAPADPDLIYRTTAKVTATIGGVTAPVVFAGLTPTFAGLYQVNVQVPAGVPAGGAIPLVISATDPTTGAAAQSNSVTIAVQ